MLFSQATCVFVLSTGIVSAVPFQKRFEGARRHFDLPFGDWAKSEDGTSALNLAPAIASLGGSISKVLDRTVGLIRNAQPDTSDTQSKYPLPEYAQAPSEGLTLYKVAVGRGTQNYTCDLSNSTAVPVAAGAVANLYDITAAVYQGCSQLMTEAPVYALATPYSVSKQETTSWLLGHHYFTDATTPYFNLDTLNANLGQGGFAKLNSTAAPPNATTGPVGQKDENYGAVPWLKLETKDVSQCSFQEVYRVNTAGGQPPASCEAYKSTSLYKQDTTTGLSQFQIQYSAEYWFYSPSS